MGSVVVTPGFKSVGSVVVVHGLSCSLACGIFSDQRLNLLYQADSYLLHYQGSSLISK